MPEGALSFELMDEAFRRAASRDRPSAPVLG